MTNYGSPFEGKTITANLDHHFKLNAAEIRRAYGTICDSVRRNYYRQTGKTWTKIENKRPKYRRTPIRSV